MKWHLGVAFVVCSGLFLFLVDQKIDQISDSQPGWSEQEVALMSNLHISSLASLNDTAVRDGRWPTTELALTPGPSAGNRWADNEEVARFGQHLFFDKRLSQKDDAACADCHQPKHFFTDGKALPKLKGRKGERNTPTVVGAALSPWQFWDGRSDSLWSQALGPIENANEQGNDRASVALLIRDHYKLNYEALFGELPELVNLQPASPLSDDPNIVANWQALPPNQQAAINQVFANVGKAIAAYERKLMPGPSRFDYYVQAVLEGDTERQEVLFNAEEKHGLRLFLASDGGRCVDCHNGPNFTNNDFQAIAVPPVPEKGGDLGRIVGVDSFKQSEFNCGGAYSDASLNTGDCDEGVYTKFEGRELTGAFKVPSLRNISKTAPYMHRGQLDSLREVLKYYNRAPMEDGAHSEIMPLKLLPRELRMIEAFLHTLDSDIAADPKWLRSPLSQAPYLYLSTLQAMP